MSSQKVLLRFVCRRLLLVLCAIALPASFLAHNFRHTLQFSVKSEYISQNDSIENFATACTQHRQNQLLRRQVADNSSTCETKVSEAVPAVACEISMNLVDTSLSSETLRLKIASHLTSCVPRVKVIKCSELEAASLPCERSFAFEEYDYHTQHHCISSIVDNIIAKQDSLIPRILHYVWYYGRDEPLEFYSYIGIDSTARFLKADAIFFWNDGNLPSNRWWQELISQLNQPDNVNETTIETKLFFNNTGRNSSFQRKVTLHGRTKFYSIFRRPPTQIYGNKITLAWHKSDMVRLEALLLYGGTYIDTDIVSLRDLNPLLTHPVVLGHEGLNYMQSLGNSVIFAARNASYLNIWHHSYRTFKSTEWSEHSTQSSYAIATECPQFIHVENNSLLRAGLSLLYHEDANIAHFYVSHLLVRWKKSDGHSLQGPEDLINWNCTAARVLRGLYFGTCTVCGKK